MKPDSVIAEIRRTREAYAEKFAGDIRAMIADLRARQQQGRRTTVARPAKRIEPAPTRKP
jgi:hypothetical protein